MIKLNQFALDNLTKEQWEDIDLIVKGRGCVLGHKTGDGKSVLAIAAWAKWGSERVLILGGRSAATTWNSQPQIWADTQVAFLDGQPHKRVPIWDEMLSAPSGAWYSTYQTFLIHMKETKGTPHWDLVIADEAHKLRKKDTQLYEQGLTKIRFDQFIGLSATWASRGPQDLWAILHLIDRAQFSSYWRWVHQYCYVDDTGFGNEIYGIKDRKHLQERLNGKFYISRKSMSLPARREQIDIYMSKQQQKVYDMLDNEMMAEFKGTSVVAPTQLAKLTRLHQLAAFPQLLFPDMGPGPALEHIVECIEDDPHTVIYTYFAEAIPLIAQALQKAKHKDIFALKGGTPMKVVDETVRLWKQSKGIMICSIKFAESFRIDTTNTAYVLSFSWDPNENIQAEGRLRARDSILKDPPLVKYYIVKGSIMEAVKGVVNGKTRTVSQIFDDYQVFRRELKHEH